MNISKYNSAILTLITNYRQSLRNYDCFYRKSHWSTLNNISGSSLINECFVPFRSSDLCFCTNHNNRCWSCGKFVNTLFCNNCRVLQKVNQEKNYFDLLEIEKKYDLKLPDLSNKYRTLQSMLHPDKFGNKSQDEIDISEEYSSAVNKAYSTLHNPVERGLYMLKLKGVCVEEESIQLDPEFLMEIMEINERIESETDISKLSQCSRANKEQIDRLLQELSAAFQMDDVSVAKKILTTLKYYTNIDLKIKEIKQKHDLPD